MTDYLAAYEALIARVAGEGAGQSSAASRAA